MLPPRGGPVDQAGRVTLNGTRAPGPEGRGDDEVRVDGKLIAARKQPVYIALNKPVGMTCTTESHIEDNIVDFIGHAERIFPVGRLDKDSEGLILLTNDGDIVNRILRAENEHEKEYLVQVNRPITDLSLGMFKSGVKIMGVMTKPCKVLRIGGELSPDPHSRIEPADPPHVLGARLPGRAAAPRAHHRHRLGSLKPGEWRYLSEAEIAGLSAPAPAVWLSHRAQLSAATPSVQRRPLARATRILRARCQPAEKVLALIGPVSVAKQHAAGRTRR